MIRPSLLIFSSPQNAHVRSVVNNLSGETIPYLCTLAEFASSFAASIQLSNQRNDGSWFRTRAGSVVALDCVEAVWWWRPGAFPIPKNSQFTDHLNVEYTHFWTGLFSILAQRSRWYNNFHAESLASSKIQQLTAAKECGFLIPETLVTSDPVEARRFAAEHEHVIFKALLASDALWRPTQILTNELSTHFNNLFCSPTLFQKFVEADLEYRVIVIDDFIEAVAFELAQSSYPYDVRVDVSTPRWKAKLPDEINSQLRNYVASLGLRYGAIDLRRMKDGSYVFMEINPAGEFLYLDESADTQIAQHMAQALSAKQFLEKTLPELQEEPISMEELSDKPFLACTPKIQFRYR